MAAPVCPEPQGRDALSVRGVGGRQLRGRRVPRRPGDPPRHQRDGAPRARPAASEERYRGLVQCSPDLIFEMDGNGVYTFYSDRTEEVIGWRPDELIGRPFVDFVDMSAFPQAAERLAEISANPGQPSTDRLLIRHKDGRLMPFEVSVVGQVDETGRLAGDPRRRPRHRRARAPRARAPRVRGPLPVPRRERPRRRVQRRRPTRASCTCPRPIEQLTGFRPAELIGETFTRSSRPRPWRRVRALERDVGGPVRRRSSASSCAQGRRHRAGRDPLAGPARRPGRVRRRPRLRARHQRAGAPGGASCATPRSATAR